MDSVVRKARFHYAVDSKLFLTEKPYSILTHFDDNQKSTNIEWNQFETEDITNIRGSEHEYLMDQHGFCFVKHHTRFDDWMNRRAVEEVYLPEIQRFIIDNVSGADEVQIFDWRRRRKACRPKPFTNMNDPTDSLGPACQVHLDQSPSGVLKRMRLLMGNKADYLSQGRVRIINVWRPVAPVEDWPLALCDGSTMGYSDLLDVDLIRKDYIGGTMYAKYRPGYKWYYLENQRPDEVCLFKNFDSDMSVPAPSNLHPPVCPHVSFSQDNATKDAKPRESIEVRAFTFTYPDV